MGRFRFDGREAGRLLDSLLTRRVDGHADRARSATALVTNDEGGILDDVLVYHLADSDGDDILPTWSSTPATAQKIWDWIRRASRAASDVDVATSRSKRP